MPTSLSPCLKLFLFAKIQQKYYLCIPNLAYIRMKLISWGFIGCGEVTEKKSGPAFNEVEGSHVEAVMSRSEEKARSYAERHHIRKWYTDAQELIDDPEVNAIYIATPPSSHATFAIMAMKAGKPVYVEKPLAASYEDCARINRISEQTGVPWFVGYYRRGLPRKPDPQKVLHIARRMGVSPASTAYFGDTAVDMDTAHNAGALAVGVLWGFRPQQELTEHGAQILLSHPRELFQKLTFCAQDIV